MDERSDLVPARGRVAKRAAILRAARAVFGRDGYPRAGIDTIAAEAGVSTRTIYNHFAGKQQLFAAVLAESTTQVANRLTTLIDRHLDEVADLEGDLAALGRAWVGLQYEHAEHFALIRRMDADVEQLPAEALEAWHAAGPERAQRALARQLRRLAERGLLQVEDADRAANHYIWLVLGEATGRTYRGAVVLDQAEIAESVAAGVRAFLNGYRSR